MSLPPAADLDPNQQRNHGWPRFRRPWLRAVLSVTLGGLTGWLPADDAQSSLVRFGFSSKMFSEVNETDARAALKMWARTVATQLDIPFDPSLGVLKGSAAIRDAFLNKTVDAVTMSAVEFWEVRRSVTFGPSAILSPSQDSITQEYLLLVQRDNPAVNLGDLRSGRIAIFDGPYGCLSSAWLETLLLEAGLGPNARFFSKISLPPRISQAVLPLYFRQVDACVVTREGFQTMCELNPQVGRQLRILARSPELIAAVCGIEANYTSPALSKLIANIGNIADNEAGRQTLALFHTKRLLVRPLAIMDETCTLLDRHQALLAVYQQGLATAPKSRSESRGRLD